MNLIIINLKWCLSFLILKNLTIAINSSYRTMTEKNKQFLLQQLPTIKKETIKFSPQQLHCTHVGTRESGVYSLVHLKTKFQLCSNRKSCFFYLKSQCRISRQINAKFQHNLNIKKKNCSHNKLLIENLITPLPAENIY